MGSKQPYLSADTITEIVNTRFTGLVLYARSWNVEAAEDIVQEALLKWIDQKNIPPNPVAWLFKTIRNEAVTRYRQSQRRQKHETEAALSHTLSHGPWFIADNTADNAGLLAQEAAEKLQNLPMELREIVILRIWNQLSFEEIAELTAASKTTVFRRYTEALEELRRQLL